MTPAEVLLEEYRGWLLAERGVQVKVARGYLDLVRPFVARHAAADEGLGRLSAGDVTAFLTVAVPAAGARRRLSGWRPRCARCCGSGTCRA